MKKMIFMLFLLSFLMVDAQARKKRVGQKRPVKKVVKKKSVKKKAVAKPFVQKEQEGESTNLVANVDDTEKVTIDASSMEPINSMSILNAKSPSTFRVFRDLHILKKGDSVMSVKNKPLEYGYIDEKDILRSITVWEILDLNERVNQYFYYNQDGLVSQNKSLYRVLIDAVNGGKISEVYDDEMFTKKLTPNEIKNRIQRVIVSDELIDKMNAGKQISEAERREYTDVFETKSEDVKLIKIKGVWYIDGRDGQMKYRLLGIAPMGVDPNTRGLVGPDGKPMPVEDQLIDLFWIFYPNAREELANNYIFNGKNLSSDLTFDDVLNSRRFTSIIYRSENGVGTGRIRDYIPEDADAQLEESERIKAQILEMENDMWIY